MTVSLTKLWPFGLLFIIYQENTDNPLYTDSQYNNKIRYNDNLTVTKPSLKR